jgi:hypothetical protein
MDMGKPNWACATCGMYSSRKESIKRHIKNLHSGNAIVVSYTDYLVGRKSGIYASYSNPIYISKNEPSLLDKITEEYCKEIAKECARQIFHPALLKQQSLEPSHNNHGVSILNQPYDFWSNRNDIFGLEIKICNKCLAIAPVKVLFHSIIIVLEEALHTYATQTWWNLSQTIIDKEELANNVNRIVPMALRDYVNAWTNNKNMLIGIEVPYVTPDNINDIIDLSKRVTLYRHERRGGEEGERKLTKSIALPFSVKRCLYVDLTNSNSNNNELYHNWAERIVKEKQTILNNDELMNFLEKVKHATFAFFRIEKHKGNIC